MAYWNESMIACPFYLSNDRQNIYCENRNRMAFYDREAALDHIHQYCGEKNGWEQCSIAQMLKKHYKKENEDDKHKEKD